MVVKVVAKDDGMEYLKGIEWTYTLLFCHGLQPVVVAVAFSFPAFSSPPFPCAPPPGCVPARDVRDFFERLLSVLKTVHVCSAGYQEPRGQQLEGHSPARSHAQRSPVSAKMEQGAQVRKGVSIASDDLSAASAGACNLTFFLLSSVLWSLGRIGSRFVKRVR